MGLSEKKSPLGNSLTEAGKWRYPALVFVSILLQFFPLSILEDGQCAYLHAHTGSQYRPLSYNIQKNNKTKQAAFPLSTHKACYCFFMTSFPFNGCPCMFTFNFSLDKGEEKGLMALTPSECF